MEEKKEDAIQDKEELEGKPRTLNFWVVSTVVLAILLVFTLMFGAKITGNVTGKAITSQEAGSKVLSLVNKYFVSDGSATLSGAVTEESGLYKVGLEYNSNQISVYITKDGKSLILPNGIVEIAQLETTPAQDQQQQPAETMQKSDKPVVELFVMSFCPYGVRAENNIMPILTLLGNKIDFKVKFIVGVSGNTINDLSSLHGLEEAKEDARQVAIMKYYPDKYLAYLKEFNDNCYTGGHDAATLDKCWKNSADKLGIDTKKIETAAYGEEGINLLKQDEADAGKYGATGSPTLIINGAQSSAIYSGTEATQTAICSAFNTAPSECGTAVASGSNGTQPAGSCGV